MSTFKERKAKLLRAVTDKTGDKSPKGSVDWAVLHLLDVINRQECFASTSSCAGRICLLEGKVKGQTSWLLVSHEEITTEQLQQAAESATDGAGVSVLFEPAVLHVECIDIQSSFNLVNLARRNGFKESGVSVGERSGRIIARLAYNARAEVPLPDASYLLTGGGAGFSFVQFLVGEMNERLTANWQRIERLRDAIKREYDCADMWWFDSYAGVDDSSAVLAVGMRFDSLLARLNEMQAELTKYGSKPETKKKKSAVLLPRWKQEVLQRLIDDSGLDEGEATKLVKVLPRKYEKYGDCVLLQGGVERDKIKDESESLLWSAVAAALKCKRVGEQCRVTEGEMRKPGISRLLYDPEELGTVVFHRENGIVYQMDVAQCMFSSGNLTEKVRVSSLCGAEDTVLDLYAGIGYFTLSFLVHGRARHVYCCEMNPHAVAALRANVRLNGIDESRVSIMPGDNRVTCAELTDCADIVNLGLLPTSEPGYKLALRALHFDSSESRCLLHIHENVHKDERDTLAETRIIPKLKQICAEDDELRDKFKRFELLSNNHVKWYAPKISHMVYDIHCCSSTG